MTGLIDFNSKKELTAVSRYYRDGQVKEGDAAFEQLDQLTKDAVYQNFWRLDSSKWRGYPIANFTSEEAFQNAVDLAKKCKAIDQLIIRRTKEKNLSTKDKGILPSGAVKLDFDQLYDCGFDPRYSFDGTYRLPEEGLCTKVQIAIFELIAYACFLLKAFLSLNKEERTMRQMILSCALAEKEWAKFTKKIYVDSKDLSGEWIHTEEYIFLKTVSGIYKALYPEEALPANLFPADLLYPIHRINKPLEGELKRTCVAPISSNWSLASSASRGFWRLSPPGANYESLFPPTEENREERKLYVFHSDFIEATADPADRLKEQIRKLRPIFSNLIAQYSSFEECKAILKPILNKFQDSWNQYIGSHEVLEEVGAVFTIADPLKEWHTRISEEMTFSEIPLIQWIYGLYKQRFGYRELKTCEELNKEAFLKYAPDSLTCSATYFQRENPFTFIDEEEIF